MTCIQQQRGLRKKEKKSFLEEITEKHGKNIKGKCPPTKKVKFCKNKNQIPIVILIAIAIVTPLLLQSVSAENPTIKIGNKIDLLQTCNNCTYCNISRISYPNQTVFLSNLIMTKDMNTFNYTLNGSYTITSGCYDWWYVCGNTVTKEDATGKLIFCSTTTGNNASLINIFFYIAGLGILIFFLGLCIFSFVKFDNLLNRVGMIGLSYLFLIGISFVSWQMCLDFIGNSFIADMIYYLWIILMYASIFLFPLGFMWYIYSISKIKEIDQLINKGFSEEDAERRVKNRRKYGK